jgi:Caspase domain
MIRAGVFIGVDKAGDLQLLHDAAAGARRMYEWACAQGMPDQSHAKLITDAGGRKVDPDLIYDAIKTIVDGPGVDQLIVYFAGHGVNINRHEHWLLTDAPIKPYAAVDVSSSVELARYCGIQHVVFFSDACRVAPQGIQASSVRGVDIFPNDGAGDKAKPVDQFFSCFLGKTAAELQDPAIAAGNFSALYTDVLLHALKGSQSDVLEPADTSGPSRCKAIWKEPSPLS